MLPLEIFIVNMKFLYNRLYLTKPPKEIKLKEERLEGNEIVNIARRDE